MPSVPPNISTLSSPATQVSSLGVTDYNTIQTAISGGHAYLVRNIYQYTSNITQLTNVITLKQYDANGVKYLYNLTPTLDPYQSSSALNTPMYGIDYTLDGQNGFYPTIEANTTVELRIKVESISVGSYLPSKDNFDSLEYFEGFSFEDA